MNKFGLSSRKFLYLFVTLAFITEVRAVPKMIKGIDLRKNVEVSFKINKTKPSVYYFLSASCPCSQGTFNHLNQLQKKYKDFQFIGFHSSLKISKQVALDYFSQFQVDFPIIFDPKVFYADEFKALKTPHVFIYSAKGDLLFQGGATNSKNPEHADEFFLRDALEAISKGEKPKVSNPRTIGCRIERSS